MRTPPGCEYYEARDQLPAELRPHLEDFAFRYGTTYDSYLVTEDDRHYFWSREHRGVVGFYRWLKYLHVVGGLIAAEEDKPALVAEFQEFLRLNRKQATFYNITPEDAPHFLAHGFQVTKCGEEPILDLAHTTWRGNTYEWLRRQENFCKRQGLTMEEVSPDLDDPAYRDVLVPELQEISKLHLSVNTAYGRELKFFEGSFRPLDMCRRRLFVARSTVAPAPADHPDGQPADAGTSGTSSTAGRVEAFVVCNPSLGGQMWAVEIYRRRPDAPRGVIPYAILQTARRLQAEGVRWLSLSLVPAVRCAEPREGESVMVRRGTAVWWNRGNWVFDVHGIYHFKSRFRPGYRDMFFAAWPRHTIFSVRSFFLLWGVLEPTFFRMCRHLYRKWRQRERRSTLAEPDANDPRLPSLTSPLEEGAPERPDRDAPDSAPQRRVATP